MCRCAGFVVSGKFGCLKDDSHSKTAEVVDNSLSRASSVAVK